VIAGCYGRVGQFVKMGVLRIVRPFVYEVLGSEQARETVAALAAAHRLGCGHGIEHVIKRAGFDVCERCVQERSGLVRKLLGTKTCSACKGKKVRSLRVDGGKFRAFRMESCPDCGGTGEIRVEVWEEVEQP
jgi:hypothetical protein